LASGLRRDNAAEFWKTDDNQVTVNFKIVSDSGLLYPTEALYLAVLPEGFRPIGYIVHDCGYSERQDGTRELLPFFIPEEGVIIAHLASVANAIMGTVSFFI